MCDWVRRSDAVSDEGGNGLTKGKSIIEILKMTLACLWMAAAAFTMPVSIGWIALDITGHSKGYSYDLGSEKDFSIMLGFFELFVWLLLVVPCSIYVFRRLWRYFRIKGVIAGIVVMVLLFLVMIYLMGGWEELLYCFGIGVD